MIQELMTKQDILILANELAQKLAVPLHQKLDDMAKELKEIKQPAPKKLVLTSAKEVAEFLGVSEWAARDLMRHPNFPKSITKRTGKYNTGKWRAVEVEQFFKINKNKF